MTVHHQREVLSTRGELELSRFELTDHSAVHEYATDPLVYRFAEWGPNTADQTTAFLIEAMGQQEGAMNLAVLLNGKVIGAGAVWTTSQASLDGELGYSLNSNYWGRGYGTLVASMLLDLGFHQLGLHQILATCAPENVASARVLLKNNFIFQELLAGHKFVRGKSRDSFLFMKSRDTHSFAHPVDSLR